MTRKEVLGFAKNMLNAWIVTNKASVSEILFYTEETDNKYINMLHDFQIEVSQEKDIEVGLIVDTNHALLKYTFDNVSFEIIVRSDFIEITMKASWE